MAILQEHLEESREDAIEDCEELLWLLKTNHSKIVRFLRLLKREKSHIPPMIGEQHTQLAGRFCSELEGGMQHVSAVKASLREKKLSRELLTSAGQIKQEWGMYLRSIQGIIGSLMVSLDWQSPSYDSSTLSQAGFQRGEIVGTLNDYKRDHHLDAYPYEQAFLNEYIDVAFKPFVRLYATSSGMAAFSTILNFLIMEKKARGTVMVGKNVYFENKELIAKSFGSSLVEVDESETDTLIAKIRHYKPSILFLDSLANSPEVLCPDVSRIVDFLVKSISKETSLVIDNTCTSIFLQPVKKYLRRPRHLNFFAIESLNKFHQFGMDRVTGGIMWGYGRDANKLFTYRMHLGTNIPDASLHALPWPNRKRLEKRMMRLSRNAFLLARGLQDFVSQKKHCAIEHIIYPGLPDHPCYKVSGGYKLFRGAFFVPRFKKQYHTPRVYQNFVREVIRCARKEGMPIIAGTSFGFSLTRVYVTALRATTTTPFVRISPGTETRLEVQQLVEIFKKALCNL